MVRAPTGTPTSSRIGRRQLVLAVNDTTLLPVVVPAAPYAALALRLRAAAGELLRTLGLPGDAAEREEAAMEDVAYAKATNRQVLGILVDFAKAMPFYLEHDPGLLGVTLKLAGTPCGPLYASTVFPNETAMGLFGAGEVRARPFVNGH